MEDPITVEYQKKPMLEQNVFNITTFSFDDNKVLKSQLDMLIFVHVCRTINKNLYVLNSCIGSGRTKESNEINKGSLYCKTESKDYQSLKIIRS